MANVNPLAQADLSPISIQGNACNEYKNYVRDVTNAGNAMIGRKTKE